MCQHVKGFSSHLQSRVIKAKPRTFVSPKNGQLLVLLFIACIFANATSIAAEPLSLNDACSALRVHTVYALALESFVSKQYAKSIVLYKSLLPCQISRKIRAFIHLGLGRNYQEQSNKLDSVAEYTLSIRDDNSLYQAYTNRGLVLASLGRLPEAVEDLNTAIRLEPTNYIALTNRGVAHATLGKFAIAIRDFNEALRVNPSFGEAYLNRGIIFELSGDLASACADWQKAVKLRQFSAKTWIDTQCSK